MCHTAEIFSCHEDRCQHPKSRTLSTLRCQSLKHSPSPLISVMFNVLLYMQRTKILVLNSDEGQNLNKLHKAYSFCRRQSSLHQKISGKSLRFTTGLTTATSLLPIQSRNMSKLFIKDINRQSRQFDYTCCHGGRSRVTLSIYKTTARWRYRFIYNPPGNKKYTILRAHTLALSDVILN